MPHSAPRAAASASRAVSKEPLPLPLILFLAQLYVSVVLFALLIILGLWPWALSVDSEELMAFALAGFLTALSLALFFRTAALIHKRSPLARAYSMASLVVHVIAACILFLGAWALTNFGGDTSELEAAMAVSVLMACLYILLIRYVISSPDARRIFALASSPADFSGQRGLPGA